MLCHKQIGRRGDGPQNGPDVCIFGLVLTMWFGRFFAMVYFGEFGSGNDANLGVRIVNGLEMGEGE